MYLLCPLKSPQSYNNLVGIFSIHIVLLIHHSLLKGTRLFKGTATIRSGARNVHDEPETPCCARNQGSY